MSQPLLPYPVPAKLQSPLLLELPDAVPPTDELEAVQSELRLLKQKSLERAKKADGDLKAIEIAIKKLREREKGKAKAVTKVKREPSYTPSLDHDDRTTHSPSITHATIHKGTPSSSSHAPSVVANAALEAKKLKKKEKDKKRKRDAGDSDGEHDAQRPRKFSPHPPSVKETHQYKPSKLSGVSHPKATAAPDWSLPSSSSLLLPPRPPIQPPPQAVARRPIEVTEDFTKVKATQQQTPVSTFYTSIEPWLRGVREEDVGWLEYTADEVEPYVMPKLGRHYTEIWEDEDIAMYGGVPTQLDFSRSHPGPSSVSSSSALPKWDSSLLTESDLATNKGLGPMTERLVSAMLPVEKRSAAQAESEDAHETRQPPGSGAAVNGVLTKEKVFVADFEERVKDTARFLGLMEGEPDYSQNLDDPVASALRQAQRQLKQVVAVNKARKARLADIARDRLAYQEYVEVRDSIDKNISLAYTKLQKKDGPKINKKKKKGDANSSVNGVNSNGAVVPLPNPASIGLGPDEDGMLAVPDALRTLVDTRREWVDVIGAAFEEKEREFPGRMRGLPQKSVFEGIDEEVRQELGVGHYFLHWEGALARGVGERADGSSGGTGGSGS